MESFLTGIFKRILSLKNLISGGFLSPFKHPARQPVYQGRTEFGMTARGGIHYKVKFGPGDA
jgi:hypothetical protein